MCKEVHVKSSKVSPSSALYPGRLDQDPEKSWLATATCVASTILHPRSNDTCSRVKITL